MPATRLDFSRWRRVFAWLAAGVFACGVFLPASGARAEMVDMQMVRLQSLDKVTARTMTFEAKVGSTIKFGTIYIKVQACRKAPLIERQEAASFLQVWEITPEKKSEWVFSGWMFASAPALSAMDHPIYDVWVLDCPGEMPDEIAAADAVPAPVEESATSAPQEKNDPAGAIFDDAGQQQFD